MGLSSNLNKPLVFVNIRYSSLDNQRAVNPNRP